MIKKYTFLSWLFFVCIHLHAQNTINVTVDPLKNQKPISPYIYGRNNNVPDDTAKTTWQLYNDAGVKLYRENHGNNATKYNWKKKISSHPDWYNNVYANDWDAIAKSITDHAKGAKGFFAFQLLGKVASNEKHNFNEAVNDPTHANTSKNLAGGGVLTPSYVPGNPSLYLQDWPADSTVAILDSWKNKNINLDQFPYWNMDNEPDIWQSTHDDVDTNSYLTLENYVQNYIAVAKLARASYPNIKLVGPAFANEWQWYNWNNNKVLPNGGVPAANYSGVSYTSTEYFIKRIAEEQKKSGLKLLDVFDLHFYYNYTIQQGHTFNPEYPLQLHRIWFDTTFIYNEASGVKRVTPGSGWDAKQNKDYIFLRAQRWLDEYMGAGNGVTMSLSEVGAITTDTYDPNITACWYANHLGTFADHGVEIFTPWDWYQGQWEVLNLFSNNFGKISVQTLNADTLVNVYSSLSQKGDSLILAIVNTDKIARNVNVDFNNFTPAGTEGNALQLSGLPTGKETFISKTQNSLKALSFPINTNVLNVEALPARSITLVKFPGVKPVPTANTPALLTGISISPNPAKDKLQIQGIDGGTYTITISSLLGTPVKTSEMNDLKQVDISGLSSGTYLVKISKGDMFFVSKFVKE